MNQEIDNIVKRIQEAFNNNRARIIYWEDIEEQFVDMLPRIESEFSSSGITIINIKGNELSVKRRILREEPSAKFLLYCTASHQPLFDLLYDVKLAAKQFSCNQSAIWAEECVIEQNLFYVIDNNPRFFRDKERRAALAQTTLSKSTEENLLFAMLGACFNIKSGTKNDVMREIASRLIIKWIKGDSFYDHLLEKSGLTTTFWTQAKQVFNYSSENPSIEDLAYDIFAAANASAMKNPPNLSADASIIIFNISRDVKHKDEFEQYIAKTKRVVLDDLIDKLFDPLPTQTLLELDYIPEYDEMILSNALERLKANTLTPEHVRSFLGARSLRFYYFRFKPYYGELLAASNLSKRLDEFEHQLVEVNTPKEYVLRYAECWSQIDRAYRLLVLNYSDIFDGKFKDGIKSTYETLCKRYDRYLEDLASEWQKHLEGGNVWPIAGILSQNNFYKLIVEPSNAKDEDGERVAVIISDAFRYEMATELKERLNTLYANNKISISLEPMLSMLPSYTDLGMAALLPHETLAIIPDNRLTVLADEQQTSGAEKREKILKTTNLTSKTMAVGQTPDKEELAKSSIVYAYLNTIDTTGEDISTQNKVFKAALEAFEEVEKLVAMLLKSGFKEIFLTADHGFIYQNGDIDNYSYIDIESMPEMLTATGGKSKRRFVVAENIPKNDYLMHFDANTLSLDGAYSIGIPKGVRRFRLKGSGSAFVHGGATLQEVVVPLLKVKCDAKTSSDYRPSKVELFDIGRALITGTSISATLFQCDAVGENVIASELEIAAFAPDDMQVSDTVLIALTSDSEEPEKRKTRFSLKITDEADEYETIQLRVRRKRGNSNKFEILLEHEYKMQRVMGMDF